MTWTAQIQFGLCSVTGPRPRNEDRAGTALDPGVSTAGQRRCWGHLYALADGVGSSGNGHKASAIAVQTLLEHYYGDADELHGEPATVERARTRLQGALQAAHTALLAHNQSAAAPSYTTLTAVLVLPPGGGQAGVSVPAIVVNVGDSSAVAVPRRAKPRCLTVAQVDAAGDLTEALGNGAIAPVLIEMLWAWRDALILCSDGVYATNKTVLPLAALARIARRGDPQRAARRLVAAAERCGSQDNRTALVLRYEAAHRPMRQLLWGGTALVGVLLFVLLLVVAPPGSFELGDQPVAPLSTSLPVERPSALATTVPSSAPQPSRVPTPSGTVVPGGRARVGSPAGATAPVPSTPVRSFPQEELP